MSLTKQPSAMKLVTAFLALAFASYAATEDRALRFLSWYDGWGSHCVWGLGEIGGTYTDAWVKCGEEKIKVQAIYDTHVPVRSQPTESQSQEVARRHNLALAEEFLKKGVRCEFKNPRS
jgi:hypothetical protein